MTLCMKNICRCPTSLCGRYKLLRAGDDVRDSRCVDGSVRAVAHLILIL